MKTRQDAWEEKDDLLLAETILKHIKEGSTQLNAFEETGDLLNRTAAACGFRWNAVVRQQYTEALDLAKKERKQRSRLVDEPNRKKEKPSYSGKKQSANRADSLTMKEVIAFLSHFTSVNSLHLLQEENNHLRSELEAVKNDCCKLEKELQELKEFSSSIQNDYKSMMQIMERARKLTAFAEEPPTPVKFKMEQNGNLEKIAE